MSCLNCYMKTGFLETEVDRMLLTVIIPCYNSAKTIVYVVEEIKKEILKRPKNKYQIILVNDDSKDNTFQVISDLAKADPGIVAIDLARNFGHANAKMAAVPYIEGDTAVCMDDDGQHPADKIYAMVDKVTEGYDLVYAHFLHRKQSLFRRAASACNTRLLELTGGKKEGIYNSSYIAWSSFAIRALKDYHSPFVSAGPYLMRCTDKVANVEMDQRERIEGHSSYNLKKLVNVWITEFTNFSLVPLRAASVLGCFCAAGGMGLGIIIVIRKLLDASIAAGYTSYMAVFLFISGVILVMIGLLGEYVGKIYMLVSGQPQYFIRTIVNEKGEYDKHER